MQNNLKRIPLQWVVSFLIVWYAVATELIAIHRIVPFPAVKHLLIVRLEPIVCILQDWERCWHQYI